MARPKKNNADYFTHDSDMRNDVRIKAVRRKYKLIGYAIWNFILEVLTDSEHFEIEWNNLSKELLSADFDVEVSELTEVVDYCVVLGLLQLENNKLFSKTHQDRFKTLLNKRQRDVNRVIASENHTETPQKTVITSENTYSKVKESKVNNIPPIVPPHGGMGESEGFSFDLEPIEQFEPWNPRDEPPQRDNPTQNPLAGKKLKLTGDRYRDYHEFQFWLNQNCPIVATLRYQLTCEQFSGLIDSFEIEFITDLLKEMDNYKPLKEKNNNVNTTFQAWAKKRTTTSVTPMIR